MIKLKCKGLFFSPSISHTISLNSLANTIKLSFHNSCRLYVFKGTIGTTVNNAVSSTSKLKLQPNCVSQLLLSKNDNLSSTLKRSYSSFCCNCNTSSRLFNTKLTKTYLTCNVWTRNAVSNNFLSVRNRLQFRVNSRKYFHDSSSNKSNNIISDSKSKNSVINSKKAEYIYKSKSNAKDVVESKGLVKNIKGDSGAVSNVKEMRRLFELAKAEKWKLTGAIILLLISSSITMAIPFSLGKVIDLIYTANQEQMKSNLNTLSMILFTVFIVGGVCNFGRVYLMNVCGHRITKDLRQKVFKSIVTQEVAFFDKNKTGELINRLSADTALVGQCVTMNISDGLRSTVMAGAGISMMFYVSSELALVGLAIVPPVAAIAVVYGRYVRKITKAVQDALAESTQVAEERIGNIRTVKSFSHEKQEMAMYDDRMESVFNLAVKESFARGLFFGLTGFSGNIIILTVLYYGVSLVGQNQFTVGNLSAFLFYAAYVGISLSGLSSFYAEMNKGLGASTRLWEIVDRVPHIPISGGLKPEEHVKGDVSFQNVVFSYPSRPESTILNKLNLSIKSGSVTAVVGQSGSGKSTLASLVIRLYDPQAGLVTVDGLPVSMYDIVWLRSHIGTVSQEPVLFSGTIRENIAYGANDPSGVKMEAIEMAAMEANAYDFITKDFPEGFETRVGERGIMLSGGQKQRVAIARALVKNPRILLLDEATSALDAESEHLVQEALERIMKGRTVLTIAHRLSTIRNADQIAVLKDGSVTELGTYNELISKEDGAFRKLVQHQAFASTNQSIISAGVNILPADISPFKTDSKHDL